MQQPVTKWSKYLKTRASYDLLARIHYGLPLPACADGRDRQVLALRLRGLVVRGAVTAEHRITEHGVYLLALQAERMRDWRRCPHCLHAKSRRAFGKSHAWCLSCRAEQKRNDHATHA